MQIERQANVTKRCRNLDRYLLATVFEQPARSHRLPDDWHLTSSSSYPVTSSMRYVHALLCLVMLLFIAVQYNDPDGLWWMAVYLVPATWTALAVIRPALLTRTWTRYLLLASVVLAMAGTFWYWPDTPRWWTRDVWYETEQAREGMGMMIVTGVLILVWLLPGRNAGQPPLHQRAAQ